MTVEQLQKTIQDEYVDYFKAQDEFYAKGGKSWFTTKRYKEHRNLMRELSYQELLLENKIYDDDEWVTKKIYTSEKSLADARLGLSKILSKLHGVEVKEYKGVQAVYVTTKWKVYHFTIHSHYRTEVLESEIRPVKSLFGSNRTEEVITKSKVVYQAWLDFIDWHWREY